MSEDISETQYALRFHPVASENIAKEKARYTEISGVRVANDWAEGLLEAMAKIAYMAPFLPLATESDLFPFPVRVQRYQRRRGAPTYRVLFTVRENGDGPHVIVLTVRHGAMAPMTAEEAALLQHD